MDNQSEGQKVYVVMYRYWNEHWGMIDEQWMPHGVYSTRDKARRVCEGGGLMGDEQIIQRWYWPLAGSLFSERLDVLTARGIRKTYVIFKTEIDGDSEPDHWGLYTQTAELPKERQEYPY